MKLLQKKQAAGDPKERVNAEVGRWVGWWALHIGGQFRVAQLDASGIPAPEATHAVACWAVHRFVPATREQVHVQYQA